MANELPAITPVESHSRCRLCTNTSAIKNAIRIATMIKLCHCLAFTIGWATASVRKKKNEISTTAINKPDAGVKGKIRASSQIPANIARGVLVMVSTLVQFLTAVSRKPAITAAA